MSNDDLTGFHCLDLLNRDFVYPIPPNEKIKIEEKSESGKGCCYFTSDSPVIFIKAKDRTPSIWSLSNNKRADGAFFVKRSDISSELHIIEMKSTLNHNDFLYVINQWKGMYLVSLAVLGILRVSPPSEVKVYVAYKQLAGQLIFNKVLTGGGAAYEGSREWITEKVELHHGITAKIVKGQRYQGFSEGNFDCDFGEV